MSTSRSIREQTHRQSDIVPQRNQLDTLSSLGFSNELSASRNDAFVLDANHMSRGVLLHSAKEDQSGTLSIAMPSRHLNSVNEGILGALILPIRLAQYQNSGSPVLTSTLQLVKRTRNDSTSTASGIADNPALRLRGKQKQKIAVQVNISINTSEEKDTPTDIESASSLDGIQRLDKFETLKCNAANENHEPTEVDIEAELDAAMMEFESLQRKTNNSEDLPPSKKARIDSADNSIRKTRSSRDGDFSYHEQVVSADRRCGWKMWSRPASLPKKPRAARLEQDEDERMDEFESDMSYDDHRYCDEEIAAGALTPNVRYAD